MYTYDHEEEKITDDVRKKNIINFIMENERCTKTDVIKDGQTRDYGSKKVILKLLKDLISDDIVIVVKAKSNAREHPLIIKRENPILNLQKQLSDIDTMLIDLISSSQKNILEIIKNKHSPIMESRGDVYNLHVMWFSTVGIIEDAFAYRYKVIWPNYSPNILNQLYTVFFTQLATWYKRVNEHSSDLIESYNYLDSHDQNVIKDGVRGRYFLWFKTSEQSRMLKTSKEYSLKLDLPLYHIHTNEHFFKQLNVSSEYTELIDYLFRMNVDYLDFVYPEIYGIYGGHAPKYKIDHSYRKIYMKKFKRLVNQKKAISKLAL